MGLAVFYCLNVSEKPESGSSKLPLLFAFRSSWDVRTKCHQEGHNLYKRPNGISMVQAQLVYPKTPAAKDNQPPQHPRTTTALVSVRGRRGEPDPV
jgi:hypothetical protein